nr:S1 RNA-binding domain-containing protein [Anaerolineae bacterium]
MTEINTNMVMEPETIQSGQDGGIKEATFSGLLDQYDYRKPRRGELLEGVILNVGDNEVIVDVGVKHDALVPREDLERLDDSVLEQLVPGQDILVYVLRPSGYAGDLIVSINKALEQEDWVRAQGCLDSGEVIEADVIGSNKGGVLVSFGRLRAFVPQSHLTSIPRGASANERQEVKERLLGETLFLKVIDIDRRNNRLVMSERAAQGEARRARLAELEAGQVVTGRVATLKSYGAFVDIGGIDGLIHISELAHQWVNNPDTVLSVDDEVEVLIKQIDYERERVSLSRKALLPGPWDTVLTDYEVDDLVSGTVTSVVDFGAFVMLPSGVEGLVYVNQMSTYNISQPGDLVQKGDDVLVRIIDIDPDRKRLTLSMDAVSYSEHLEWMESRSPKETGEDGADAGEGTQPESDSPPDDLSVLERNEHVEEG